MMDVITTLRKSIATQLSPLIDRDYVLLDLPYHANIGDVLIWEGEHTFLQTIPYKCLKTASCRWSGKINKDTIILLHGGGNFGDLYREYQEFRLKIIQEYPDNKIIMFPQSACYQNEEFVDIDSKIMRRHKNLYLCARDIPTYDFMKSNFSQNHILLVPDMAFYISDTLLSTIKNKNMSKSLFLARLDKENSNSLKPDKKIYDIRDWPTCERLDIFVVLLLLTDKLRGRLRNFSLIHSAVSFVVDAFALSLFRPYMVKKGLTFINCYNEVVTTRLHALISSVLLDKRVYYIDNISGKLSAYTETWLKDYKKISSFKIK